MVKTHEVSVIERAEIIGAYKCGVKPAVISRKLGIPDRTVRNVIKKFDTDHTVENKQRSGRPRALSERNVRSLVRITRKNRRGTLASFTAELNHALPMQVSVDTVRRALHEMGYHARAGKRKPLVTERNRKKRLLFANLGKAWSYEWSEIIFSDESRFVLFANDSHKWVWRQAHEKYDVSCLVPTVAHSPGVMVWGCFTRERVGPLIRIENSITGEVYLNILEEHLLPFIESLDASTIWIFQDDNARPHRTAAVDQYKENNDILSLPWPPQSPDLNPIEHLWDELERRVRKRENLPKNLDELFAVLAEEWYSLEGETLANLVDSMPRRIQAVIDARGNPTPY